MAGWTNLLMTLPPLEEEERLIRDIAKETAVGPSSSSFYKYLTIGHFYHYPHQISHALAALEGPVEFMNDVIYCSYRRIQTLMELGESQVCLEYLEQFLEFLLKVSKSPDLKILAGQVIPEVLTNFTIGIAYPIDSNLKRLQLLKAQLIEYMLNQQGYGIDHEFPPVDGSRPRIKVGFLWNDCDARTETFVGLAHLRGLDPALFDVYSYVFHDPNANIVMPDQQRSLASAIRVNSKDLVDLSALNLRGKVAAIREGNLDLLFVVNNFTWGYSEFVGLAAHRLARTQIVNYCAVTTTGFRHVDVWLSGETSEEGAGAQEHYTEALVKMPGSVLCFDGIDWPVSIPHAVKRSDFGIPEGATMFVSGANFYKLMPEVTVTWVEILKRVPNSYLVLYPMNPNWGASYPLSLLRRRLYRELMVAGLGPDRIRIVGPWPSRADIFNVLSLADVYLDSFPHAGGISTSDALLVALPTVTLRGRYQRSIQGANALEALGLTDFVATSVEDYIAKAVAFANDDTLQAKIRLAILSRLPTSSLLNVEAFGLKLSDAFADIYRDFVMKPGGCSVANVSVRIEQPCA